MSDLSARIMADLKEAMRNKNEIARDTLRMLKSSLTLKEVEKGQPLSDAEAQDVLTKAKKGRLESAAQYREGGRTELAEKEEAEAEIIAAYLPKLLSEDETRAAVEGLAKELGIESKRDMGKLMTALKERHPGQVDGKLAAQAAQKLLS